MRYLLSRFLHFWYNLRFNQKVEPGEELNKELYYIPEYEGDPNRGNPLRIIRHVFVTTDPSMRKRPCFEVQLPNGKKRFYLDPRVGSYEDKQGKRNRILTKDEAGL